MGRRDTLRVDVVDLDGDGYGLAEADGQQLRIPGAVTGDVVIASILHRSAHWPVAWCRLERVLERGPHYRQPNCGHAWPAAGQCGGCPLMHVSAPHAAAVKRASVASALRGEGLTARVAWHAADTPVGYRNRGQFVVAREGNAVILGAYAPRSHDVVSLAGCLVLRPPLAETSREIGRALAAAGAPVHPEPEGVRYVTLRASASGEVLADLVINGSGEAFRDALAARLIAETAVTGVSCSANTHPGNAIRVGPSIHLAGRETVTEPVGGVALQLAAASFSQLNSPVTAEMYGLAAAWADPSAAVVWDLYAGAGGLGLTVAKRLAGARLFGAESVPRAVELARNNAADAGVSAEYLALDLAGAMPPGWPEPDLVLLNPPRRGLDAAVRQALVRMAPPALIYMSCNPKSFAADVRRLSAAGYRMAKVAAFDMLPGTGHAEVIALLQA